MKNTSSVLLFALSGCVPNFRYLSPTATAQQTQYDEAVCNPARRHRDESVAKCMASKGYLVQR